MKRLIFTYLAFLTVLACESPADVELSPATPTLVIDAFINDLPEDQRIILNFSQSFFNNEAYRPATGAIVSVIDDQGNPPFIFNETSTPGEYVWQSTNQVQVIGTVGTTFTLQIEYEGETFIASSTMNRTTPIEEILFFEEQEPFSDDLFYEARMTARDPVGVGDAYWVKTFWNDEFLGDPSELNIAFDAGISPGGGIDGQQFIIPISAGINPTDEDESYELGDRVRVEIHSITREAYDYFIELQIQTDRPGGFAELFAQPLANLTSNVAVQNNPDFAVLGFFSVSSVSEMQVVFTEDLISE